MVVFALCTLGAEGCVTRAPTIAHVHIGHAITAFDGTPEDAGFFMLAEAYSNEAVALANAAIRPGRSSASARADLAALNMLVNTRDEYTLTKALEEARRHIRFAAIMGDATPNVRREGQRFAENIDGVLYRNSLIRLNAEDAALSASIDEFAIASEEIARLVSANINGEDLDGDGVVGSNPLEYGMRQLRRDLDRMIAAEDPPYTTVDEYYLFNLIRIDGNWLFRTGSRGGAKGY